MNENLRIIFVRKETEKYVYVARKDVKHISDTVSFANRAFKIDFSHPVVILPVFKPISMRYVITRIFMVDVETGDQLLTPLSKSDVRPGELDAMMRTKFLRDALSAESKTSMQILFYVLAGIGIGALIAIVVMQFIQSDRDAKIIELLGKAREVTEIIRGGV